MGKSKLHAARVPQRGAGVAFPKVVILVSVDLEREKIVKPALEKAGLMGHNEIWTVVTGVGKVSSAISTTALLSSIVAIRPDAVKDVVIVNVGVCSGNALAVDAPCVQINRVVNNDLELCELEEGKTRKEVVTLTQEVKDMRVCYSQDHSFVGSDGVPEDCAGYVDMELYGIAQACAQFGVRCVGIKSVCKGVGGKVAIDYETACKNAFDLLADYLSNSHDVVLK